MSYVIGLDIGFRNLGFCVYDCRVHRVVHWENACIVSGKHRPKDNVKYIMQFLEAHRPWFDHSFAIVVEQQMRVNLRIMAAVIEALFYTSNNVHIIPPRQVKVHYNLSTGQYASNKAAAVEWIRDWLSFNGERAVTPEAYRVWTRARKKDDLADALLLVLFYLDTFSNQLVSLDVLA